MHKSDKEQTFGLSTSWMAVIVFCGTDGVRVAKMSVVQKVVLLVMTSR